MIHLWLTSPLPHLPLQWPGSHLLSDRLRWGTFSDGSMSVYPTRRVQQYQRSLPPVRVCMGGVVGTSHHAFITCITQTHQFYSTECISWHHKTTLNMVRVYICMYVFYNNGRNVAYLQGGTSILYIGDIKISVNKSSQIHATINFAPAWVFCPQQLRTAFIQIIAHRVLGCIYTCYQNSLLGHYRLQSWDV